MTISAECFLVKSKSIKGIVCGRVCEWLGDVRKLAWAFLNSLQKCCLKVKKDI